MPIAAWDSLETAWDSPSIAWDDVSTDSLTAVVITVYPPPVTVRVDAINTVASNSIILVAPIVSVTAIRNVNVVITPVSITIVATPVTVAIGVFASTSSSSITLVATSTTVTIATTAIVSASSIIVIPVAPTVTIGVNVGTTPVDINVAIPTASVITGATTVVTAQIITLVVLDVKVYDYNDAYVLTEGVMVKINIPEIMSFSTDITTDMEVIDAMETDLESVDGTQQVTLLRKTDNLVIDLKTAQAVPENQIYVFNNALIRQISDRDNRAVKQLRLFMQSVQNDDFATMDTIIELPHRDDVQIRTGDLIQSDILGTKYDVIAIDTCTLRTRWRIGARKLI